MSPGPFTAKSISDRIVLFSFAAITTGLKSIIKAQSLCLINRLSYLGEGAQAAAGRRVLARQMEEGRRRDRQVTYMAHIRGRGLSRQGQIFV